MELPALSIRPPTDPLDQFSKLAAIQGMMRQNQLLPGQLKMQQQQIQENELQNKLKQQQISDQQVVMQAQSEAGGDPKKWLPAIQGKVSPQTYNSLLKTDADTRESLAKADQAQLAVMKDKNDRFMGLLSQASALPDDQYAQAWPQILAKAEEIHPGTVEKMKLDPSQPVPKQQLQMFGIGLQTQDQYISQAQKQSETKKNDAEAARIMAQMKFYQANGLAPGVPLDAQEAADWMHKNPGKGPSDFMKYKASIAPTIQFNLQNQGTTGNVADVAKRFGYTPQAFDNLAENYWKTGELPKVGRGGPALAANKAIMNRANDLHQGESIVGNAQIVKANESSLKKLQGQFDQVTAFENTAGKNLDVFLNSSKKVIDSGVPWINTPLRAISGGLGGEDQAAFNAARTTALTEIAKVLNSSNASGVLSDSARHEVEGLIGPNANLRQIYSAANILKQDMANRHDAYQQQINDIQGRLRQSGPSSGGGKEIHYKIVNGQLVAQ